MNTEKDCVWIKNKNGTVTLRKTYHNLSTKSGNPKQKKFTGKTKKEAKEKMEEFEEKIGLSTETASNSYLFIDYVKFWASTYKRNTLKESSYDNLQYCIKTRIEPFDIAHFQLSQLNSNALQVYINSLIAAQYSRATIKKTYQTINNCLNNAVETGMINKNPLIPVKLPAESRVLKKEKNIEIYEKDEIEKICKTALMKNGNSNNYLYYYGAEIVFLLYTGIRIGEACALSWKDIDLKNKVIIINKTSSIISFDGHYEEVITSPKTQTSNRIVDMTTTAYNMLDLIKEKNKGYTNNNDRVFLSKNHLPASRRNISRCFESIKERAGIEKHSGIHSLRHTFITMMMNTEINIKEVSRIVGHAKTSTTYEVYTHITNENRETTKNILQTF